MTYSVVLRLIFLWVFLVPFVAQASEKEALTLIEKKDWHRALRNAEATGNRSLLTLAQWQYALDPNSGAPFEMISSFIAMNPDWPEQKKLRVRAEQALREGDTSHADIIRWFETEPPITGIGKIALARALSLSGNAAEERIRTLVQEAWREGDFDDIHEKDILNSFSQILTEDDHIARIDRLLWEKKTPAAKRMFPRLSRDQVLLAEARIALIGNKSLAVLALARVPSALKDHPGLLYDRLQYRDSRGDDKAVRELLLKAPDNPPYPEKWWKAREQQVRVAIDNGEYDIAETLLSKQGDLTARELADATWLHGWLQLEFLKKASAAFDKFSQMYDKVRTPSSRARAAYWAGRAAEASGDSFGADSWYEKAAAYSTTFYGQLGALKSNGSSSLRLPPSPEIDSVTAKTFENSDVSHALKLCLKHNARTLANALIAGLVEDGTPEEAAMVAKLAQDADSRFLAVRAAKKALQKNIVLIESGYPRINTPDLAVERALVLAVARQESEFDARAKSAAGAIGLIQLMPKTAKESAKKMGIRFDKNRLYEPEYNLRLGSHYLSRMISNYDGSYVMAIAAYNAGPGNVKKWVRRIGTPGNDFNNAINWIEKIPFYETRNYVQRVMENLQVYRRLEEENTLKLAEDLVR